MNKEELKHKVHSIVSCTLKEKIYISPVELLMKIGVLSAKDYEDWRFGRVPYLEKVCKTNLSKLSFIMKELRAYALENHLKSSWTAHTNQPERLWSLYSMLNVVEVCPVAFEIFERLKAIYGFKSRQRY